MSWQPRAFRSVKTFIQNFAPSVCSIQMPRMSRVPSGNTASARYTALLRTTRFVTNLHPQCIEKHHRIHRLERPALPGGHLRDDAISDRADQIRRHVDARTCRRETPWISRTVIPRAYSARILSSNPVNRRACLANQLRLETCRLDPEARPESSASASHFERPDTLCGLRGPSWRGIERTPCVSVSPCLRVKPFPPSPPFPPDAGK